MKYMDYIQKPWCVKIELSKGCNLQCKFCPVSVIPSYRDPEQRQFLSLKMCVKICTELVECGMDELRIELTMRGEPTLNPRLYEVLEAMRTFLPKMQITMFSNGVRFFKEPGMISKIIDSGVNILCIDCYNNTYDRFKTLVKNHVPDDIDLVDFSKFSAYKRHHKGYELRVVDLVPDIAGEENNVNVREIHNMAGNNMVYLESLGIHRDLPLDKGCARPFRELTFTFDGKVLICCHDWAEKSVLGNINETPLSEIWYGKKHHAILKDLYNKDRSGAPCNVCDYHGGYRLGFLHNPEEKL